MTVFKKGEKITVLSRSGKDQTGKFPLIEQEVLKTFKGLDIVLDGERMPVGFMQMDSKTQYKLVSNSTKKGGSTDVCLAVYDYMPLKMWEKRNCTMSYEERYATYKTKIGDGKYLFGLPAMYVGSDISQIENWLNWAKDNDKEGVIVKTMDAMYEWDRSANCVKLKSFSDIDVIASGFRPGNGKLKDSLGAIEFKYKGNTVKVGSGFSEKMRQEIWENQKKYLGKKFELIYFEETQDKNGNYSLRFPVFKDWKLGD